MKLVATLLLAASVLALRLPVAAATAPRGTLLELHSCELYAGGCIVSSEASQGGRYLLRVWNFSDGSFAGASLAGLTLALLQESSGNLARPETVEQRSVLYVPKTASPDQRAALAAWARAAQAEMNSDTVVPRIVPMTWEWASRVGSRRKPHSIYHRQLWSGERRYLCSPGR